jgi:hypothetical protein
MPKKRKSQFLKALEQRREEARRDRARREREENDEAGGATPSEAPRPIEDKVLRKRTPFLWPTRPARRQWK